MCEHSPTHPLVDCFDVDCHGDNLSPHPTQSHPHRPTTSHKPKYGHVCWARWGERKRERLEEGMKEEWRKGNRNAEYDGQELREQRVKKGRDVQKRAREQGMALPAEECLSRWYHVTGLEGLEGEVVLANHNENTRHYPIQLNESCDTRDKLATLSNYSKWLLSVSHSLVTQYLKSLGGIKHWIWLKHLIVRRPVVWRQAFRSAGDPWWTRTFMRAENYSWFSVNISVFILQLLYLHIITFGAKFFALLSVNSLTDTAKC